MRPRTMLSLLVPTALACSGSEPSPTELRPQFAPSCPFASITPNPSSVTKGPGTQGTASFIAKNNCTSTVPGLTFTSSRTGAVTSVGVPSPRVLASLAAGASVTVSVSYTLGASGSGTVVLTGTTDFGQTSLGTQTVTVSSSCPAIPPGGCIGVAPRNQTLWNISGNTNRTSVYQGDKPEGPGAHQFTNGSRIEAGTGGSLTSWINNGGDPTFPITRIGDGNDLSWHGGHVRGNSDEGGSVNWDSDSVRDYHDQTAFGWAKGLRGLIEHFSAYNKGDGIGMGYGDVPRSDPAVMNGRDGMVIRFSALEGMGDDAVENDLKDQITVYQNYLSGVTILSARPAKYDATTGKGDISEITNTSNKVVTFDGNLCWLRPKRFADSTPRKLDGTPLNQAAPGVFRFWKWQKTNASFAMKISMRNNILRYDETAQHDIPGKAPWTGDIWGSLDPTNIISPSNNTVLLPNRTSADGPPPGFPPTGSPGFTYIYGAAAKTRWNSEINAWVTAHPEVKVTDKGLL